MQDEYISASQLARMLNLSGRGTMYQMRRKGILPEGRKSAVFEGGTWPNCRVF